MVHLGKSIFADDALINWKKGKMAIKANKGRATRSIYMWWEKRWWTHWYMTSSTKLMQCNTPIDKERKKVTPKTCTTSKVSPRQWHTSVSPYSRITHSSTAKKEKMTIKVNKGRATRKIYRWWEERWWGRSYLNAKKNTKSLTSIHDQKMFNFDVYPKTLHKAYKLLENHISGTH